MNAAEMKAMQAQLAALQAENAALKAKPAKKAQVLTAKVSKSGGISVYGLGRFPVTLYPEQWTVLFSKEVQDQVFAKTRLSAEQFALEQAQAEAKSAAREVLKG